MTTPIFRGAGLGEAWTQTPPLGREREEQPHATAHLHREQRRRSPATTLVPLSS